MFKKNIFILIFFFSFSCKSKNILLNSDSTINIENYRWVITNSNPYTDKINIPLKKYQIDSICISTARNFEESGFPFSIVEFKFDSIKNNLFHGHLTVEKGRLTKIDSISVKGYNKFPKYLLKRFLNIKIGEKYNQRKIEQINHKLESNFNVEQYKENSVLFNKSKTILFFYLNKKYNNSFEGFIGLNNNNDETNIYGKIDLNINNALNLWESIEFKWNKINEDSQELSLFLKLPYFLNSNLSLITNFNLLQFENTYINRKLISSLELVKKIYSVEVGYVDERSNIINNFGNSFIKDYKKKSILFNSKFFKKNIFELMNFSFTNKYNFGLKQIEDENEFCQKLSQNLFFNIPIFSKIYLDISYLNDFIIGKNILENEKIGVGGANQMRGFLENSFFSKHINVLNLENKYYFNNNSYVSFFFDHSKLFDLNLSLQSFGFGIGLDMKNDIFIINYAIPKYEKRIEINNSKIHFKYILKF